jgi:hypothetical protein
MSEAVARYRSILASLQAGPVLDSGDAAWLSATLMLAVQTNVSVERAMEQPRKQIRVADASVGLFESFPIATPVELEGMIRRYRNGEFKAHRDNRTAPAAPDRTALHRFLIAYQGEVPSVRTLQNWKCSAQRSGGLNCAGPVTYSGHGKTSPRPDVPVQRPRGVRKAATQDP